MSELQGRHSAHVHASFIARWVHGGDASRAYRQFIQLNDDLAATSGQARTALTTVPPDSTRSRWDDAIAALVEFRLQELDLSLPSWVSESVGHPDEPWEPPRSSLPLTYRSTAAYVPTPFLRRGVLIEAGELESV